MAHCPDGLRNFHRLRLEDGGAAACLFAFDVLRLNSDDLRPFPLEERRARLRKALRGSGKALRLSEHLKGDGAAICRRACALGLEGIVSKRRDARYQVRPQPDVAEDQEPELRTLSARRSHADFRSSTCASCATRTRITPIPLSPRREEARRLPGQSRGSWRNTISPTGAPRCSLVNNRASI